MSWATVDSRSDVLNLFKFIDWAMILPEGLKKAFWEDLKTYEEDRQMPYVTSVEQIGFDRGLHVGGEEGAIRQAQSMLLRQLTRKIGAMSNQTLDQINALSIKQMESLSEALLDFSAIDDLTTWLENHG
jgi:Domain of unknown function (DUF4351)